MKVPTLLSLVCSAASLPAPPALGQTPAAAAPASSFRLTLDPALQPSPYSGRVYVVLSKSPTAEPRRQMGNWFAKTEVLALDVSAVTPGSAIDVTGSALAWPTKLADLEPGEYRAQAVARRSLDSPHAGAGPDDLYSDPAPVTLSHDAAAGSLELKLTHAIPAPGFTETDRVKEVTIVSPSLSHFYGRDVTVSAGVILPEHWSDDASLHYPTVYFIHGFGGDHRSAAQVSQFLAPPAGTPDVLIVVPDPSCHFGHSVFADSANNGPRGKALIDELIPAVEKKYHGAQSGSRRFVTGISSGGWGSLWLQVAYPDDFNGVWSHCPDPVDFRDFQRIDLYAPGANMYKDEKGDRRPLARRGDNVMLWYDDFVAQEEILGDGGQIRSFEAVFSPRGTDGRPVPLFDRATGAVNPATAKSWEGYDIRLVLERHWNTLGARLAGKLHVYAGGMDTFYLEGAAAKLKESLAQLGSDATVEIVEGMPHTIIPKGVEAMWKEIGEKCR